MCMYRQGGGHLRASCLSTRMIKAVGVKRAVALQELLQNRGSRLLTSLSYTSSIVLFIAFKNAFF